ncbi:MAG: hypothetical protein ABFC80_02540 [Coriobacteriales bacterium]
MNGPKTPETNTRLSRYIVDKERRSRVKKIVALVLLVLLLLLLGWAASYYSANRTLPIPFVGRGTQEVQPPQFLYAISGPEGPDALSKPIAVCVTDDDRVYVVDDRIRGIRVYDTDGRYKFSFNAIESAEATRLRLPGDVVESPSGEIWVTDRRLRGIFVFSKDGAYLREYLPEGVEPRSWGPISVSFDAEGNVYVVDIGTAEQHHVVAFDPSGVQIARWGRTVQADNLEAAPGGFYFPNATAVSAKGDVFVSDSNNRRVQVFGRDGTFKYIIPTSGTPRGLVIDGEQRLLVVDALAHTIDVYALDGKRITAFGTPGMGLGQFQFPNDIALDKRGRIFVTDRENHQVQVWGWPTNVIPPIEGPREPVEWAICLSPLLLLLIPLFRRRKSFLVTEDFIEGMVLAEKLDVMNDKRFRWVVPRTEFAKYEGREADGIALDELLKPETFSESDVVELVEKTGVDRATAILITMAQRIGRLATEDVLLREPAEALGVEVLDRAEFLERYAQGTEDRRKSRK